MATELEATPQCGPNEVLPLLREILVGSSPVVTCLVTISLLGSVDLLTLIAGAAAGLVAAIVVARLWVHQVSSLARWLRELQHGIFAERPAIVAGSALEWLCRPGLDLARRLRRAERRIARAQRTLDALIASIPDPLLIVDRRLVIVEANPAARRQFRLDRIPAPLALATRDPGVLAAVTAALELRSQSTVVYSPVDDRQKQFAVRVQPFDGDSSAPHVLLGVREQTEQVMIERMRSDFVANASHEIRTPLAALIGIVETLRGPARDDPAAREMFLATMADETARMNRLVEDLLSLSRVELAANQPPQDVVDTGALVRELHERMMPLAVRAKVELVLVAPDDLPAIIGDIDQLYQLVTNLVDNAIKYGGPGKSVRTEVRSLEAAPAAAGAMSGRQALEIAVVDQGDGIAAEHLPRLTERFYRVDKARSRRIGGTGLGLSIVKHIVRRHQGHLSITSRLGEGSRFAVLLPTANWPQAEGSADHRAVTNHA